MNPKLAWGALIALIVLGSIFVFLSNPKQDSVTSTPLPVQSVATTSQASADSTVAASAATTYSLADVAAHNSADNCWAVINGKVYDLTSWINQHPGGPERILSLCGTDGSAAFNNQHSGQRRPASELANFYIAEITN